MAAAARTTTPCGGPQLARPCGAERKPRVCLHLVGCVRRGRRVAGKVDGRGRRGRRQGRRRRRWRWRRRRVEAARALEALRRRRRGGHRLGRDGQRRVREPGRRRPRRLQVGRRLGRVVRLVPLRGGRARQQGQEEQPAAARNHH